MDAGLSASEAGKIGCASCCPGGTLSQLASVTATELVSLISLANLRAVLAPSVDVATSQWSQENTLTPPRGLAAFWQKNWDGISTAASVSSLLE